MMYQSVSNLCNLQPCTVMHKLCVSLIELKRAQHWANTQHLICYINKLWFIFHLLMVVKIVLDMNTLSISCQHPVP